VSAQQGFKNKGLKMVDCPEKAICWRRIYTDYFQKFHYEVPPTREELFFKGFVPSEIMPKGGIYADIIPLPGDWGTFCPATQGLGFVLCHEYKKQQAWKIKQEKRIRPNRKFRIPISDEIRRSVAAKAHYKCVYCGKAHNEIVDGKKIKCVVDHFIPLVLGGSSDIDNLVFACSRCNSDKKDTIWKLGCRIDKDVSL
jgi:hypothetical protein